VIQKENGNIQNCFIVVVFLFVVVLLFFELLFFTRKIPEKPKSTNSKQTDNPRKKTQIKPLQQNSTSREEKDR